MSNEHTWKLSRHTLAGKTWGPLEAPLVLGLHGWLDNAATFNSLAPELSEFRFVALDFCGHGLSEHSTSPYYIWEYATEVAEWVLRQDQDVHIVGHSLGAGVALLASSLLQERCLSTTFIEGIAPMVAPAEGFAERLRKNFSDRQHKREATGYESVEHIYDLRQRSPVAPVSLDQATVLIDREVREENGRFFLRHDPNLTFSSLVRLTPEQVYDVAKTVKTPCFMIQAEDGLLKGRVPESLLHQFRDLKTIELPGNHHLHLGKESAAVSAAIKDFLSLHAPQL